ncbi:MAG: tetratricopeptide repeat protein [Candidatus Thorarchaeota archaeon]
MASDAKVSVEDLRRTTEENPRSIVAWRDLAKHLEENRKRTASSEAWTKVAVLYLEEDRIKLASEAARRALWNMDRNPEALRIEGVLSRDYGHRSSAEKELKRSLKFDGSNAQTWTDLGILYYEMERYKEAEEALGKAILIDPDVLVTQQYSALVHAETQRLTKAISILKRAEHLAYDADYEFWFHYGIFLWRGGVSDEATKTLRRAVRLGRENLRISKEAKRARREIGKLVKRGLPDYDSFIKLGDVFEDTWQNRLAELAYRFASKIDPQKLDAWILIYDITSSDRDAEEVIDKAYFIDNNHPDVLLRQAEEFDKVGMKREALHTFQESLTKDNAEYVKGRIAEIEEEMMECWGGYEPPYDY